MHVGKLSTARAICAFAQVEDILVPNWARYQLNWLKLRAWEWEEFDSLILLDLDAVVRSSLAHLFSLPPTLPGPPRMGTPASRTTAAA